MKLRISETTDGLYLGREIDLDSWPLVRLGRDVEVSFDRHEVLQDGTHRLVSSSYTIDAVET